METKHLIKLKNVSKFYYNQGMVSSGFSKVNLEFDLGEFVAITGESGSGKSTLLNVISGLDSYEEGEMYIDGKETSHYNENDFEKYRKTYIGNIFQTFNLVNSYTVYQNIELVLLLNGFKKKEIKNKIIDLIKKVDLYKYRNTRVSKLSGGQKQRVAIARALAKDTPIIIADEPTGNLDAKSSESIIKLLATIAKDKLVIIVTHNYEQVEKYVTRKIEMNDGRVREDSTIKEVIPIEPKISSFSNITISNKIRLGMRNSFNIFTKFILLFFVFAFVIIAFLAEYSSLKALEQSQTENGYNDFFQNYSDKRIIIQKEDLSEFTENDFEIIKRINHISSVEKNDVLMDTSVPLNDDLNYYYYGYLDNYNKISKVDIGRLPEKDNEIIIESINFNYYDENEYESLFEKSLSIYDNAYAPINSDNLYVVGIIKLKDYSSPEKFYVSEKVLEQANIFSYSSKTKITITLNNSKYTPEQYDPYMHILPSNMVSKGKAVVSNDFGYLCKYGYCKNKNINIDISNLYYEKNMDLIIDNLYTKNTFKNYGQNYNYDYLNGTIFISYEDYNELFNGGYYQSSVFVDDPVNLSKVVESLENNNYKALVLKDTLSISNIQEVIKLFRVFVTIVLFIVLFFIAYFVIKLIQKSKNIYYSTVRILGGERKTIKSLIRIELLTIFNVGYACVLTVLLLQKYKFINVKIIYNLIKYLAIKDYLLIYIILFLMNLLISFKYSRKLFKSSAMKTYREEV